MGVDIGTGRISVSMGYGAFMSFRIRLAQSVSPEFGTRYQKYVEESLLSPDGDAGQAVLHTEFGEYVKSAGIDKDIVDFLLQPDSGGRITYKTAGKLGILCRKAAGETEFCYDTIMADMAEVFEDAADRICSVRWF